ncbi:MAG: GNAT family N-acetyltransferase [Oscillospiraceae bacterium]|nr:GNAT family N-acetyltransferase [Oscillospiraceae bacterium]
MTIRKMTIGDYQQVLSLWLATPGMGLNDVDDTQAGIGRYLERNPKTCLVAEENGRIVGVILTGHDGRRGMIHHMAVDEEKQRLGIGKALLERAISALRGEGIGKVILVVFKENDTGNAFWENMGFALREDLHYRNKVIAERNELG